MATPAQRFYRPDKAPVGKLRAPTSGARPDHDRGDGSWVARRASAVGVVCVNWQRVCLGAAAAGRNIDVWVTEEVMQFYDGDQLLRTSTRTPQVRSGSNERRSQVVNVKSKRVAPINRSRSVTNQPEAFRPTVSFQSHCFRSSRP